MKVITIGRTQDNDIIINDIKVSRNHVQIVQGDNGNFSIVDLGSTNGTFVNEQRITGEVRLQVNDSVKIGNTILPWRSYFNSIQLINPSDENDPEPKPKHTIWCVAAVAAFMLLVGGGIAIKVFYDKKHEKIEAENKVKNEKLQQETEEKKAEAERLQDNADELLRKALISQSDKDKRLAEAKQKEANDAKNDADKARAEQKKAEKERDDAIKAKKAAETARLNAEAAERQMREKAERDSLAKVQAGKSLKEKSEELNHVQATETKIEPKKNNESEKVKVPEMIKQENDAKEVFQKLYNFYTEKFNETDFKIVCNLLNYNTKDTKNAKESLNEKFSAAKTADEWQLIIDTVKKHSKTIK